jgi:hypothetical protein
MVRPVGQVQGNGESCDLLAQLFICVGDSDQDGIFRFRDKDEINEGSGRKQGDRGLFDGVLASKFLAAGQGISCAVLITRLIANGI